MAFSGDTAWVVNRGDRTISRYDVRSQARRRRSPSGATRTTLLPTVPGMRGSPIEALPSTGSSIRRPAPATAAVPLGTKDIRVPLPGAGAEAYGAGYLWVISGPLRGAPANDGVALIDVRTRKVASTIRLGRQTTAIAYGYGSAWIGTYDRGARPRGCRSSGPAPAVPSPSASRPATGGARSQSPSVTASVWVLTSAGTVLGIDPETQRIVHRVSLAAKQPVLLAVGAGSVWTANLAGYSAVRDRTRVKTRSCAPSRSAATPASRAASRRRATPSGSRSVTRTATR